MVSGLGEIKPARVPHKPKIEFHGPTATHDQACAVCHNKHAVYQFNGGTFQPCWDCQTAGWTLERSIGRRFLSALFWWTPIVTKRKG